jgi:glucose-6-phosphate 1-dehydrogenase
VVIRIQPDEGISLRFGAKVPGPHMNVGAVEMKFSYEDYFKTAPSTGYERLLYDGMTGDATLFQRADMVEAVDHHPPCSMCGTRGAAFVPQLCGRLVGSPGVGRPARDGHAWRRAASGA